MHSLAVQRNHAGDKGEQLAARLGLPVLNATEPHEGLLLFYHNGRLSLGLPAERDAGSVCVDFNDPKLQFRLTQALSREALVKAVGGCVSRQVDNLAATHLIDATAGLGLDGFMLAAAGWQVSLVEQSPIIHALLEDGLLRARQAASQSTKDGGQSKKLSDILGRLHLCAPGNSTNLLPTLLPAAVTYLDPMFPERDKAARVKKNRYLLQQLHGEEGAGHGLLPLALGLTSKVVVKRPRHAEPLDGLVPASSLIGKTSRFDIYVGLVQRSGKQQAP